MRDQILNAAGISVLAALWILTELWPYIDTERDRRNRQKEMDQ